MWVLQVCFDNQSVKWILVCHVIFQCYHHYHVVFRIRPVQIIGDPVYHHPINAPRGSRVQGLGGGGAVNQHQSLDPLLALLAPVKHLLPEVECQPTELPRGVRRADVAHGHVSTWYPLIGIAFNPDNPCFSVH